MVWDNIGTLSPRPEWQAFDIVSLDDSLLRITHTYDIRPLGYALISSIFSDGSRGFFRRIYPFDDQPRLLDYEAPSALREPGFNFRRISIKAAARLRVYDLSWKVQIEVWSDDEIFDGGSGEPSEGAPIIDGGQEP